MRYYSSLCLFVCITGWLPGCLYISARIRDVSICCSSLGIQCRELQTLLKEQSVGSSNALRKCWHLPGMASSASSSQPGSLETSEKLVASRDCYAIAAARDSCRGMKSAVHAVSETPLDLSVLGKVKDVRGSARVSRPCVRRCACAVGRMLP